MAYIRTHTKVGTPHEKAPITIEMEVNLLIWLFRTEWLILPLSISDCKGAIDTEHKLKFQQGLFIKHSQNLAKTFSRIYLFQAFYVGG